MGSNSPSFNVQLLASLKVSFSEKPLTFILVVVSEQLRRALVSEKTPGEHAGLRKWLRNRRLESRLTDMPLQ